LQSSRRADRIFVASEFIQGIPVQTGGMTMKIKQAISSALLVVWLPQWAPPEKKSAQA
jgi:hypothetical protein